VKKLHAGALRHQLTFERQTSDLDSDGAQVADWVPAFEINSRMPAEVVAMSGRELIAAQAEHSRVTTRIRVQFRPGFKASMRAWFQDPRIFSGATVYNIEAVIADPMSRNRYLTLQCSDGTNEG